MRKSDNLLMIFTRNPELGRCKTRLAKTVGDDAALEIYKFLLQHTVDITRNLEVDKQVHYSVKIRKNDIWDAATYSKRQQDGVDLGARMHRAFAAAFAQGYKKVIIIGSDMYDLSQGDLIHAFRTLGQTDIVLGPATDGGYYLFGMKSLNSAVFENKDWGSSTVLKETLSDLKSNKIEMLEERNDVDYYEDIRDIDAFQRFLPESLRLN